ncbi:MAG: S41 family peptidase [Bacteroidia bacterium]
MKLFYAFLACFLFQLSLNAQQPCTQPAQVLQADLPGSLMDEGFEQKVKKGPFQLAQNGRFSYLKISQFSDIFLVWDETLVSMMKEVESSDGLILDLRGAHGNSMDLAYKLVSCFVDEKQEGHYSYDHKENCNKGKVHTLRPHSKVKAFTKNVIVLTNQHTRQAAEITALVMRHLPNVSIVGKPTAGTLYHGPDGREHRSVSKVSMNDSGVPVDVEVHDAKLVFTKALEMLRGVFVPKSVAKESWLR